MCSPHAEFFAFRTVFQDEEAHERDQDRPINDQSNEAVTMAASRVRLNRHRMDRLKMSSIKLTGAGWRGESGPN
jgi:hypothetical protein